MQMAKFGSYWWNLERLAPNLRPEFLDRMKSEFDQAWANGECNQRVFAPVMWQRLEIIVNNSPDTILKFVKRNKTKQNLKTSIKNRLRKAYMTIRPSYRKQVEISKLIEELETENRRLTDKIRQLEEKQNG